MLGLSKQVIYIFISVAIDYQLLFYKKIKLLTIHKKIYIIIYVDK